MLKYAVKLGQIYLKSDKPISPEERTEAIKLMEDAAREALGSQIEGLAIVFLPAR